MSIKTNGVGREGRRGDSVSRDSLSREGAATPSREPLSRASSSREHLSRVSVSRAALAEYVARANRLAPLFPRLHTVRTRPLPSELALEYRLAYDSPQNLALELSKSILYENESAVDVKSLASLDSAADSLWNGKPQQYFESMQYGASADSDRRDYDSDSLAPHT